MSRYCRVIADPAVQTWALILLLTPLAAMGYHQIQVDDPYITYRYAQNLATGRGFIYNPGEPVLGTTAPLYALLLALGSQVTDNYPLLSSILSGTALGILGLLLYHILAALGEPRAGTAAAVLVVLNPLMGDAFGFELNVFLALGFGAYAACFAGRPHLAALLLGLATLTRGDGLVPSALILAHEVWTRRRFPWIPALIYGALVGSWTLYAVWSFGSPFPNTLAAKQAMGESGLWRPFWYGALRLAYLYLQHSYFYLFFAAVGMLGLARLRRLDHRIWLILGWAGLIFAGYAAMGIPAAYNYYAGTVPFLMLVSGLGTVQLTELARARWPVLRPRTSALIPVLLVPLLAAQVSSTWRSLEAHPDHRYWTYRRTGEWLASETPEGASIGLVEIGIVGFYSQRRIVDVCGLITPAVGPHLAAGDVSWPIRTYRPDYVLLHDPVWPALEGPTARALFFQEDYEPVRTFAGVEPYRLTLYRRR